MTSSQFGYAGQAEASDGLHAYGAISRLVTTMINRIQTCTIVRVVAVTNHGELSPAGLVDVQPLVNQLDGHGNAIPHEVLHQLIYFRLQGGSDAVIMDPKVGDIGMAGFASRDISAVKASRKQSNPGSWRAFDMADGIYFGGMLNGTPVQYLQFQDSGIRIVSPNKVTIDAPNVNIETQTATVQSQISTVTADDSLTIDSPIVNMTGNLMVSGQVSDANGSMQSMRNRFDIHTHPGDSDGTTGIPNHPMN